MTTLSRFLVLPPPALKRACLLNKHAPEAAARPLQHSGGAAFHQVVKQCPVIGPPRMGGTDDFSQTVDRGVRYPS